MPSETSASPRSIRKTATGVSGLDEILSGGFPEGRPILVAGGAGCGKTLLSMQFLVSGAVEMDEPGVFIAFEERPEDLKANVASLGFDLEDLERRKLLSVDHVQVDPSMIIENGDYDLEGLFLRLGFAIDSIGAKRVVIDTLEVLFGGLSNYSILRNELRRLFEWLKTKGVTAVITAEKGDGTLTRHGLEEYVSDCVLLLDHRVNGQISTRRMRVVKYRGSSHGTNEYPFLIGTDGISVIPITSARLDHPASSERISTGVAAIDAMVGGKGFFRGSTILVSGTAGAGKSTLAAHFAHAACQRGERVLYFSFEESPAQIIRNMRSVSLDLAPFVDGGLLRFVTARPTALGMESHLATIHEHVDTFRPHILILDPASNLLNAGSSQDAQGLLVRLIDHLKRNQITALLTTLTTGGEALEHTDVEISSIVDSWLLFKTIELAGERNRGLYVLKSRGMNHSNQIREFRITDGGLQLVAPYVGPEGVLTGSARMAQEAREQKAARDLERTLKSKKKELDRLQLVFSEQLTRLKSEFEASTEALKHSIEALESEQVQLSSGRDEMARLRGNERSQESP